MRRVILILIFELGSVPFGSCFKEAFVNLEAFVDSRNVVHFLHLLLYLTDIEKQIPESHLCIHARYMHVVSKQHPRRVTR